MTPLIFADCRGECERCGRSSDALFEIDPDAGSWLYCERCAVLDMETTARRECLISGDHISNIYKVCRNCPVEVF